MRSDDCKNCKSWGSCWSEDFRDREYLLDHGKDCFEFDEKKKVEQIPHVHHSEYYPNNSLVAELEDKWEDSVASYRPRERHWQVHGQFR